MSQQPAEVYPYNPNSYPSTPTHSSSHSNGSLAPVLIVLAVIFVLTIIASVIGRCGYWNGGKAGRKNGGGGGKKKGKGAVPTGRLNDGKFQENDEEDIEFGFGNRISTSKVANDNIGPGGTMMPQRSEPRGLRVPPNGGGGRGRVRFGDHHEAINPGQFQEGS